MMTKKDGIEWISDDITRTDLIARVGVEDKHIDRFSIEYQSYLTFTVIPSLLSNKDGQVEILVDGNMRFVPVVQIESLAVVFKYD